MICCLTEDAWLFHGTVLSILFILCTKYVRNYSTQLYHISQLLILYIFSIMVILKIPILYYCISLFLSGQRNVSMDKSHDSAPTSALNVRESVWHCVTLSPVWDSRGPAGENLVPDPCQKQLGGLVNNLLYFTQAFCFLFS